MVMKLGEFVQLVELDKHFINSEVYYLWVVILHT